jgi:single-stranded DNA-binding protein
VSATRFENTITFSGYCGRDEWVRGGIGKTGQHWLCFQLSSKTSQTKEVDGSARKGYTNLRVICFGDIAEKAKEFIKDGNAARVVGHLEANDYQDKTTGKWNRSLQCVAHSVDKVQIERKVVVPRDKAGPDPSAGGDDEIPF